MSLTPDRGSNVENDFVCNGEIVLKSCRICERTFNPSSLDRHEKICEKNKKYTNRTIFKSFLQRSRELGIGLVVKEEEKKKSRLTCKEQSITRDKNHVELLNNGQTPLKFTQTGYDQCPSCNRFFNQKAADRHISWCKEQRSRLPKTPPNTEALERLQARTKYQAPRPRKRNLHEGSDRLIKSAESIRGLTYLRTHSSSLYSPQTPSPTNHNRVGIKQSISESSLETVSTKTCVQELKNKKTVKFNESFPIYNKDRNKNLDILKALRVHLSQLSTSEEHFENYILRSNEPDDSKMFSLPQVNESDAHKICSNEIENVEKRLPRFCYNCGTKYPIVSAKYCCECGVQRFSFAN